MLIRSLMMIEKRREMERSDHPPRWLIIAEGELGIREFAGPRHSDRILEYLKTALNLGNWGRSRDETPWCAVFVNWCLEQAGEKGTDHALARSFVKWGHRSSPRLGAIVVIRNKRYHDASVGSRRGFHVGFLIREGRYSYRILGGNQKDMVSYRNFSKRTYSLIDIRWPGEDVANIDRKEDPSYTQECTGDSHT
jgi:uncharacterized protein (TIGR02594 family)